MLFARGRCALAIYLIRHGETELNATRVLQPPGTPLSERGLMQARALAARVAADGVEHILSSDLTRARMTAEALHRLTEAPLELDPSLQERNFGDLRGTPYAELSVDPFAPGYAPPGGETWETFHARVDQAWERIRMRLGFVRGNLAVVTHGLVCRSLVERIFRLEPEHGPVPRQWPNTSLTIVDAQPPWAVRVLNCTIHLDDETRGDPLAPSGL
jgi:probable phosphoglycerate mutase